MNPKPELLPYRAFVYAAQSVDHVTVGQVMIFTGGFYTRDQVERTVLEVAASRASAEGVAWDPFNVTLVFRGKPL